MKAEGRLKTRLPPSFRAFLAASNGWRNVSFEIPELRSAEKIQWFKREHRDWINAYTDPMAGTEILLPADQGYFNYAEVDTVSFDLTHLAQTLCISDAGDGAVLLLNPMVIWPDGEWETWFFANWLPGAQRYRSFADWMRHELAGLTDEPFSHSVVPGELPAVYLDGPSKATRRKRPREETPALAVALNRLSAKEKSNRIKAVRQLGRIGGREAIRTLVDLLKKDHDPDVRREAAETLGRTRAEEAILPLIAAIDDAGVNSTAIHALGNFRDERSAQCLLQILREGGMYATVAAGVLGMRGDHRALESLSGFLQSKDPRDNHIGNIAGRLIADFQGPGLAALEPLAASPDAETRRRAIDGIGDIAFGAKEKPVKERAREFLRRRLEVEQDSELRGQLQLQIDITTRKSL